MSEKQAPKVILNLLKEPLKPVHETFFKSNGFVLKKNIYDLAGEEKVTHILVDDHKEDWEAINSMYDTLKKRIAIISFAPVKQLKSFLNVGGRAVLERDYFDDKLGQIFVKRIFTEEVSLHMDEVFGGNFIKYKNLKIQNHVRSGYYSDIIAAEGFEQDFNNIAIRGFIYNTSHYIGYLKESGIAVAPYELEYAQNAKYFAIQFVVEVKNFFLEYVINSFGVTNTQDPIEYVLRDNLNICHGFDITYLEKSSCIIITGVWQKSDSKVKPSFSFGNIKQVKQYFQKIKEEIELAPIDTSIEQLEAKVENKQLPGKHLEKLEAIQEEEVTESIKKIDEAGGGKVFDSMASNLLNEIKAEKVKGNADLKAQKQIVKGDKKEEDSEEVIIENTTLELSEDATIVHGEKENLSEDAVIVKGQKDGKEELKLVKGSKEEIGKDNTIVKGSKESLGKDNTIVKGSKEDLTEEKTIIKNNLKTELKKNLVAKISSNENATEEEQKKIIKDTVAKFTTNELLKFKNSSAEEKEKGLEALAHVISENTGTSLEEAKAFVVKGSKEADEKVVNVVKGENQSFQEAILIQKLKAKEDEVKQLNTKVEYYKSQLNAQADAKKRLDTITVQAANVNEEEIKQVVASRKEFQRTISDDEIQKLIQQEGNSKVAGALRKLSERESELVDLAKSNEVALRKKELEFQAKEQQISRELEKAEKQIKNRDLLLNKAKETTKNFMEKKDREVMELTEKMRDLNSRLITQKGAPDPFTDQLKLENSDLKRDLEDLKKEINVLKREVVKANDSKPKEDPAQMKAELQRMIAEKNSALTNVATLSKDNNLLKDKLAEIEKAYSKLKSDGANLAQAPAAKKESPAATTNVTVADDPNKLKTENTRLQGERNNLLNDKKTLETQVGTLRGENSFLKAEIVDLKKKLTEKATSKETLSANMPPVAKEQAKADAFALPSADAAQLEMAKIVKERDKKITEISEQLKTTESKLAEITRERDNLMSGAETVAKTKMGQLDAANKKLTTDLQVANTQLAEAKKEVTKAKSEATSFKNQLDKVKKDLEKLQKTGKKAA